MGRLILLVIALFVLIWLVRSALAGRGKRDGAPGEPQAGQGELVQCAHCGVHLPRAEARSAPGGAYCSEEHARLGPRRR